MVFELENVALGARRIRYEVLAGIFGEQNIGFDEIQFSRYCLGKPEDYLPALLNTVGYTAAPASVVAERLRGETLSRMMQKDCLMDAGLKAWLDEAAKLGIPVAAVTCLAQEAANGIAKRLGFDSWGIHVLSSGHDEKGYWSAAGWGRAAQALGRHPGQCVAIVTGAKWALAAMSAGFKGIAVPDTFTAYENFAGMDYVVDSLKDLKPDATFKKLNI